MHVGSTTRFILHNLTQSIMLTFSIRQGDPLAMMLYIVYMEPFCSPLVKFAQGSELLILTSLMSICNDVELLVEDEANFGRVDGLFRSFEDVSLQDTQE